MLLLSLGVNGLWVISLTSIIGKTVTMGWWSSGHAGWKTRRIYETKRRGGAILEQLGMKKKYRLLDAESATLKKWSKHPAGVIGTIPAGSYKAQVNNDKDLGSWYDLFYIDEQG